MHIRIPDLAGFAPPPLMCISDFGTPPPHEILRGVPDHKIHLRREKQHSVVLGKAQKDILPQLLGLRGGVQYPRFRLTSGVQNLNPSQGGGSRRPVTSGDDSEPRTGLGDSAGRRPATSGDNFESKPGGGSRGAVSIQAAGVKCLSEPSRCGFIFPTPCK